MLLNECTMFYFFNHSLLQNKLVLQQWLLLWCGPFAFSLPTSFCSPLLSAQVSYNNYKDLSSCLFYWLPSDRLIGC
jgi:hypothetical protein